MNICKLYRMLEAFCNMGVGPKDLCFDPLYAFDKILDAELKPFSDELSLRFMKETFELEFVDSMHVHKHGSSRTFALHNLCEGMKEVLMLLKNSQRGIYTEVRHLDDTISKWIQNFHDFDLLFSYITDYDGKYTDLEDIGPLRIENFTYKGKIIPVLLDYNAEKEGSELVYKTGESFDLYRRPDGTYWSASFFSLFAYDWKRDLPEIKKYIDSMYSDYRKLDTYERICTLKDMFPEEYCDADDTYNPKVVSHLLHVTNDETYTRKIAILYVDYLEDGSVALKSKISYKHPSLGGLLQNEDEMPDDTRYRFFLYIDVDEIVSSEEDFKETWIGGYIFPDHLELYSKEDALIEFSRIIPNILVNMKIPIG